MLPLGMLLKYALDRNLQTPSHHQAMVQARFVAPGPETGTQFDNERGHHWQPGRRRQTAGPGESPRSPARVRA